MSESLVLLEAKKILISGWCQGAVALDSMGLPCGFLSEEAVRWDLFGAIALAFNRLNMVVQVLEMLPKIKQCIGLPMDPHKWHDSPCREKKDVLQLIERMLIIG